MNPQDIVWGSVDLRNYILQKLYKEIKRYYINICKCYEKLFFR